MIQSKTLDVFEIKLGRTSSLHAETWLALCNDLLALQTLSSRLPQKPCQWGPLNITKCIGGTSKLHGLGTIIMQKGQKRSPGLIKAL